ncbi:integrase [Limnohabitans curvus]|uniref:Integrase n=1 Tax=Limnohabitans curvus TaxID=323423 RepID=A0A315G0Z4_9BURK|nr:site-specific integrase [Limnohabitans curvus]PUE59347.1 integrase [Limnohabitans curvus]
MASFRQRSSKWQARVTRDGYPNQVKTFEARADAERWARSVESAMDKGQFVDTQEAQRTTLRELILRYVREVTPTMKSVTEDTYRLKALARRPIANWSLINLSATRIAAFRDERLKEVSNGTVIRELAYLSSIINHARREWDINMSNPVIHVRKPTSPTGRTRKLSDDETTKLLQALEPTGRQNTWTRPVVLLAIQTAMRRSELLALRWENIDLTRQTAFLPDTKNGTPRTVPLSAAATEVLRTIPRNISGIVFPVKYFTLDAAFKRAVKRAGLVDFHFHDLRHTAITAMAEKLPNLIELSAVTGHKSLSMLKRYYHPDVEELARKLG